VLLLLVLVVLVLLLVGVVSGLGRSAVRAAAILCHTAAVSSRNRYDLLLLLLQVFMRLELLC
jgi:hypothetical protein